MSWLDILRKKPANDAIPTLARNERQGLMTPMDIKIDTMMSDPLRPKLGADELVSKGMELAGVAPIGSIMKGGMKDLLLSHGTPSYGLHKALAGRDPKLMVPSSAVSRIENPFDSEVMLYLNPSKLDPKTNWRADMRGTDMFSYRYDPYNPTRYLRYPQLRKDSVLTEGYAPQNPSKLAAVAASPKFNSFAEYEASPVGAERLSPRGLRPADYRRAGSEELDYAFNDWFRNNYTGILDDYPHEDYKGMMQDFLHNKPEWAGVARKFPTEYAEVKLHGNLPIVRENVVAARIAKPEKINEAYARQIVSMLRKQQIPIIPRQVKSQEDIAAFVDELLGFSKRPKDPYSTPTYNESDWKI